MDFENQRKLDELFDRLTSSRPPTGEEESTSKTIQNLEAYIDENERLLEDIKRMELGPSREEMEENLAAWDIEAKEILEREIKDPKILAAALDNSRYKAEVLAMYDEPLIASVPSKHEAEPTDHERKRETIERLSYRSGVSRLSPFVKWAIIALVVAVVVLALIGK
ncbi:hypothetical protein [Thiosocius teredinicola]|uniref:hypothetical protein n=1 Tax=Thiosocius teredinicola TaxID=1973002 RepID=UPI000990BEEF